MMPCNVDDQVPTLLLAYRGPVAESISLIPESAFHYNSAVHLEALNSYITVTLLSSVSRLLLPRPHYYLLEINCWS